MGDNWLLNNYGSVPADEQVLRSAHVRGATMFGSVIKNTVGIYPAELQAIARVLAMTPLSSCLNIHVDSQSTIAAIHSFDQQCNERKRLRMSARPLLQLISHLKQRKANAGGDVILSHVKAHTMDTDVHSVGNPIADYQANTEPFITTQVCSSLSSTSSAG